MGNSEGPKSILSKVCLVDFSFLYLEMAIETKLESELWLSDFTEHRRTLAHF